MLRGKSRDLRIEVNCYKYPRFFLLVDDIYPSWACYVQPIDEAIGEMKEHFRKCQESARKDVKEAFGILKATFEIILKNLLHQ